MPTKPATLPIDTNVQLPRAVRRASARADEIHAAVFNPPADPATTPSPEAPAPVEQPAPVTPEVTPAPTPETVNWEHRYNSMKGRFEKEQADKMALSAQLVETQQLLATIPARTSAPSPAELRGDVFLPKEIVDEYGEEFLGVVGKKAKAELMPEIAGLRSTLNNIQKHLEGNAAANKTSARNAMHERLDNDIPTWREINVAPEFHSWLALPDEFSGAIRHELLKTAYEQNNTPRVLAFFRRFISDEAAPAPAPAVTEQSDPSHQAGDGKIPLADLAAPGRAKTAAGTNAPVEKPIFTHAQIAKFYTDSAAGKFRGRDEERNRIEGQIFAAQREGRIR